LGAGRRESGPQRREQPELGWQQACEGFPARSPSPMPLRPLPAAALAPLPKLL
jgi:hypothetical protein